MLRRVWVGLAIFVVILLGIYYLPTILPPKQIATDFPDLAQYSNPIPTPTLDGSYVLDYESSFGDLRARLAEAQPAEREILERLLAAAKDQLHNFRIDHGVITSGKLLIQEFRLISATTENGTLIGKAIWHEDIYDPGDCSSVNVRLNLEGDILKFYYSPDGDEPGEPIILRRAEP